MKTYKIITNTPYDKGAPITYWIEMTHKYFFGLFTKRQVFGEYLYEEGGSLNSMPFFDKYNAEREIVFLKQND